MSNKALQKISLLSPTGRKATNHSHTSSQYRSIHINPGCLSMYKQHQHKRTSLKKNNNNAGPCTSVAHVESSCNKDELSSDQTMKKWKGKDPRKKKKNIPIATTCRITSYFLFWRETTKMQMMLWQYEANKIYVYE